MIRQCAKRQKKRSDVWRRIVNLQILRIKSHGREKRRKRNNVECLLSFFLSAVNRSRHRTQETSFQAATSSARGESRLRATWLSCLRTKCLSGHCEYNVMRDLQFIDVVGCTSYDKRPQKNNENKRSPVGSSTDRHCKKTNLKHSSQLVERSGTTQQFLCFKIPLEFARKTNSFDWEANTSSWGMKACMWLSVGGEKRLIRWWRLRKLRTWREKMFTWEAKRCGSFIHSPKHVTRPDRAFNGFRNFAVFVYL